MAGEEMLRIKGKELRRLHVLEQVMEGRLLQREAGEHLGLTDRQIRRLLKRLLGEGEKGLCHRSRGKPSNRSRAPRLKARVLRLYQERYEGFGPTLAAEKLSEREGISLSDETLRLWLKQARVGYPSRRKRPHRRWRERRRQQGELVQMDGSHHAWLEGRGPDCVLMAYIDDATSRVYARFYSYEGTAPAMESFWRYLERYGVPLGIYSDKHSTYRSWAKPTLSEQLDGQEPMSQFERALSELGVELIHAHSPQAKGRIERLFGTFQDRLIKEMRLEGIKTIEEANDFLESYLPVYNKRFSVLAAKEGDLHRPTPSVRELERILCIRTERSLRKDFTIVHEGQLYQVEESLSAKKIWVEQRLDGSVHLTYKGKALRYQRIHSRPINPPDPEKPRKQRRPMKPSADHPWKTFQLYQRRKKQELVTTP